MDCRWFVQVGKSGGTAALMPRAKAEFDKIAGSSGREFYRVSRTAAVGSIMKFLSVGLLLTAIFLSSTSSLIGASYTHHKLSLHDITEEEKKQAKDLVAVFSKRIEQNRDIGSLISDYFVNGFPESFVRLQIAKSESQPGEWLNTTLAPGFMIRKTVIPNIEISVWRRLYVANTNLRYLSALYIASSDKLPKSENDLYHANAWRILDRSRVFKSSQIESLNDLQDLIVAMELAAGIMREHFNRSPPEQSAQFQANKRRFLESTVRTKERFDITPGSHFGYPDGVRLIYTLTDLDLFALTMVKTNAGMKIVWANFEPFN